jgi:N,N'-diacetyllegionaminate synthase
MKINFFTQLPRSYLIAEIGVNHNGDMDMAREMIRMAKRAGADAVKFQTFTAVSLATTDTPKVYYQQGTTSKHESHYEMLQKLELSRHDHHVLFDFCNSEGIDFLSTPYDIDSAKFLIELGVPMLKTASADIVDLPLQEYIASTGLPVIVATGMAGLGEVEQVVNVFDRLGNPNLILLHCVSNYPCSDKSLNLNVIKTLSQAFNLPVGFSDHSVGMLAAVISVSLGAKVIEKHFTLDKSLSGPDHRASSTPEEFSELVRNVRTAELMLGSHRKTCQEEESQMSNVSRKSLTLVRDVFSGEIITLADLRLLRPGTGIPASYISRIVGMRAKKNLSAQHQLCWNDLDWA